MSRKVTRWDRHSSDKVSGKAVFFMKRLFCGIDVAKYEHVVSIYDPINGEYILDSLHFENNEKGYKSLVSRLLKLKRKSDLVIGFESTGHYHMALFSYLTERKYRCFLINPYMTSRFRSVSLRDAKNDNIDSRAIAQFLSFEYERLSEDSYDKAREIYSMDTFVDRFNALDPDTSAFLINGLYEKAYIVKNKADGYKLAKFLNFVDGFIL
jgi:hypothetical protein